MIIGYARVSSTEQNLDRQLETLKNFKCDTIYTDKISGKDFNRKEYQQMKNKLKCGDLLVIKSIDRLGRNYDMIIDEWRDITHNIGADILVVDMPLLDTRDREKGLTGKFISDLVLQILSYVAETERNNIKQRQAEGIRIAKEKGKHLGRPKTKMPENFDDIVFKYFNHELSVNQICEVCNMSKSKFYVELKSRGYGKQKLQNEIFKVKSQYGEKYYYRPKDLLYDLKISSPTLKKYFDGENTIINRMDIEISKILNKGENNNA